MNGAYLAREPSAKDRENPRDLQQDQPEASSIVRVIGLMREICLERNRVSDFNRYRPDVCRRFQLVERCHYLPVKLGNGHWPERYGSAIAVAGFEQECMLKEIEVNLQRAFAVWHRRGCKTANGRVERNVPCVIDCRRECEPDLASNLHPQLQSCAGIAPRRLR